MDIMSGNIFEAMRLVLPEHRELMRDVDQNESPYRRSELLDDVFEEYEDIWNTAYREHTELRIVMISAKGKRSINGVPVSLQPPLRLQTDHGCIMIQPEAILHLESMTQPL